ncbi:ABC transporter permease [Bauldia sp.]|uniref:ABC transporter permease n=1 Tax=Bauldia sp. TaxID=2575872 RepID=UPI003BA977D2
MTLSNHAGGRLIGRLPPSGFGLTAGALVLLGLLVIVPLAGIAASLASPDGLDAIGDVFTGRIARNMLWVPLTNTFVIGFVVAASCILLGGFVAWLVTMTDMPMRHTIGVLAALPFMIPTFAVALSWTVLFGDDRLGQASMGLFAQLDFDVPAWLAWGGVPVTVVLIAHLYSIAYMMIAAALILVGRDMTAAAEIAGATRAQILRAIVFPVVTPTVIAAGALCFAEAVSSFSAPAILGLPVRFHTLATRAYGAIETGTPERGYVLIAVMIVVAGAFLALSAALQRRRQAFTTVTGKAAQRGRMTLGRWRWPFAAIAVVLVVSTTIVPALALLLSSLSPRSGALFADPTLHYWIGSSDPAIAQGQAGVLRNPHLVHALWVTLGVGAMTGVAALACGLVVGSAIARLKHGAMAQLLKQLSFLPLLVPGLAIGAAFIGFYGAPIGPFPSLYGTAAILVLAGVAATLPFAVQAVASARAQIAPELEESARVAGAGSLRTLGAVTLPLAAGKLIAGFVLVFVKMVRDLDLVILLYTPQLPLLTVLAFRYASDGFAQFAHAIAAIILIVSVGAHLLASGFGRASQPWLRDG